MDDETTFVRTSWLNVFGNLLKLIVEGSIGLTFGSLALVADAANSLGDLLASLAILTWGRLTYVGPDENHPHGHERLEPLTAFLVGIVLIIVALRLLYDIVGTLLHGSEGTFALALIGGLGIAIAIKVVLYWYTTRINQRVDSTGLRALRADALTDIYASAAAVVGVVGVAVGLPILDPLAGGVVSLLILREGIEIIRENVVYLTGMAPPKATCERIRTTALSEPAIDAIRDFRAHYIGQDIEVELHATIAAESTFEEAHEIETNLTDEIQSIPDVRHVHIQLDPTE